MKTPFRPTLQAFALLLATAFGMFASLPAQADPSDIDAAARGVVRVVVVSGEGDEVFPVSHGSGFAVDAETVVTNAHVVSEALEDGSLSIGIVPSNGGGAVYGRVLSVSPRNDLALVRTTRPMNLSPLVIAGMPPPNASAVLAIGYPMNVDQAQGLGADDIFRAQPPVTSRGFLSGRRPSREFDTLLHTAPIARGNSGGPLVDECGRVVGVNSFGAESDATEAEFFFAVTVRELLPFLRANGITPVMNSDPCRSLDDVEANERERAERQAMSAQHEAELAQQAAERHTDELRREIEFDVLDGRANGLVVALLAFLITVAGGAYAAWSHLRQDFRQRAIGGSVTLAALVAALVALMVRPTYADVQERLEERLREEMPEVDTAGPDLANAAASGTYSCTLDTSRSRVVGAPVDTLPLEWTADGCVNGRTQYGEAGGQWSRALVPAEEDTVSVNRFDPATHEYVVERYLLDRDVMTQLRTARAAVQAPACGAGREAAAAFGDQQQAVLALLPDRPNERLIYDCSGQAGDSPVESAAESPAESGD